MIVVRFIESQFGWCGTCVKDAEKDAPGFCNHNEAAANIDDTLIKKGVLFLSLQNIMLKCQQVSL